MKLQRGFNLGWSKECLCSCLRWLLSGNYPLFYLLRSESKTIHSDIITANEFVYSTPKNVDETSLVVCMSRTGNTPETVAAAKKAKEYGAIVITMSISEDCALSDCGDYHFIWAASHKEDSYVYSNSALVLMIGFEILRVFENYANYNVAIDAFSKIDEIIRKAIFDAQEKANNFAEKHQDDRFIYTAGSGPVYNVAYATCICHLMEMEWIHSSSFLFRRIFTRAL